MGTLVDMASGYSKDFAQKKFELMKVVNVLN